MDPPRSGDPNHGGDIHVIPNGSDHVEGSFEEDTTKSTWCLDRLVIDSDSNFKQVWNIVTVVLLVLTATVFPFKLCFMDFQIFRTEEEELENAMESPDLGWVIFEMSMDVLFWIDLVLNFFFAIPDEDGFEKHDQRKIAFDYLRGFFLLDLIACLPTQLFELFMPSGDSRGSNKSLRLLRLGKVGRLVRLSRLSRLLKLLKVLGRNRKLNAMSNWRIAHMAKFTIALLCCIHLLACGWYLQATFQEKEVTWVSRRGVGKGENEDLLHQKPVVQWLHSLYWIMMVFTTVGFGDVYAVSPAELVYASLTMLFGVILQGIIVSRMIGVVTSMDDEKLERFKACKVFKSFSTHVRLPATYHDMMVHYIKNGGGSKKKADKHTGKDVLFDKHAMWQLLQRNYFPRELLGQVASLVFQGQLWTNRLFRESSVQDPNLVMLLTIHTTRLSCIQGEVIYQAGDHPSSVILIEYGTFAGVAKPSKEGGKHDFDLDNQQALALMSSNKRSSWRNIAKNLATDSRPDDWPYILYSRANFFGEWEIVYPSQRRATIRCESDISETLEVSRSAFVSALSEFPHFLESLRRSSSRQEARRLRCLNRLREPGHDYKHLAAITMQRHFRGRITRQHALRMKQLSPNSDSHRGHNGLLPADDAFSIQRKTSTRRNPSTLSEKDKPAPTKTAALEDALKPLRQELDSMNKDHSAAVKSLTTSQEETMRMLHQVYLEVLR